MGFETSLKNGQISPKSKVKLTLSFWRKTRFQYIIPGEYLPGEKPDSSILSRANIRPTKDPSSIFSLANIHPAKNKIPVYSPGRIFAWANCWANIPRRKWSKWSFWRNLAIFRTFFKDNFPEKYTSNEAQTKLITFLRPKEAFLSLSNKSQKWSKIVKK